MTKRIPQNFGTHSLSLFENKVLSGLKSCGVNIDSVSELNPLGLAVSGGADSVSLLVSLSSIFNPSFLRVITVDHGIRSEEESGGDADFVKGLCAKLGIFCHVEKIPHGRIEKLSKNDSLSVEAVARNLRYEAFSSFIEGQNLLALCLAHNRNDQCETVLMRFLQGSGAEGLSGIAQVRGKYVRPLLEISRAEIEEYLRKKNQAWRTDATNADTKYFRNRVRNVLVPVLEENFPGWQKGILAGAKKAAFDEEFLRSNVSDSFFEPAQSEQSVQTDKLVKIGRSNFYSLHPAVGRRLFFDSLNKIGFGGRFPYRLFEEVLSWKDSGVQKLSFENVLISLDSKNLVLELCDEKTSLEDSFVESGFCFVLKNAGDCAEFNDFLIRVEKSSDSGRALLSFVPENPELEKLSFEVSLPLLARSCLPGDEIKTAEGKFKLLSDVFTDWKIPPHLRERVVVVEILSSQKTEKSFIKAFLASHLGFKNWIVEEAKL